MKTSKVYSSIIIAKLVMFFGRIKSKFFGSHYVQENYTLKFDKINDDYIVEHYTMTRVEEQQFHDAIAKKQQEIIQMADDLAKELKAEKAEAPKMHAKPKQTAKPKIQKPEAKAEQTATDKPKKKYYHNKNKGNKQTNKPVANNVQQ